MTCGTMMDGSGDTIVLMAGKDQYSPWIAVVPCTKAPPPSSPTSAAITNASTSSPSPSVVGDGITPPQSSISSGLTSRKGRPCRAPSWSDSTPGIIFKLHPDPFVLHSFRPLDPAVSGAMHPRSLRISKAGRSASMDVLDIGCHHSSLSALDSDRKRKRSFDETMLRHGEDQLSASEENDAGLFTPTTLTGRSSAKKSPFPTTNTLCHSPLSSSSTTLPPVVPPYPSPHSCPPSYPCSTIPATTTQQLSHLVPNRILSTTSRRISTHSLAPGCVCTSCGCTVTPYWRDGWSPDVMLCNACGLRFQKFARRCPKCVYIPRKEDSLGLHCIKCGTPWIVIVR